ARSVPAGRSVSGRVKMTPVESWDLVVVGAGRSGLAAAGEGARLGARTALVERAVPGGRHARGEAVARAFAGAGRAAALLRRAAAHGLDRHDPTFKFARLAARVRERVERAAPT